jgi:hypothetical protein
MSNFSKNGAPIRTGRGIEEVKRQMAEAFEKHRVHEVMPTLPAPPEGVLYGEESFHVHATKLATAALTSCYFQGSTSNSNEIIVPKETAEELFKLALR